MPLKQHTQRYEFRAKAKQRPRMSRRGRAYTPKATHDFETKVATGWNKRKRFKDKPVSVSVELGKDYFLVHVQELDVSTPTALRGDIDNYVKSILDGLNGIAWDDDIQVRELKAIKL
jgi:Holliday junction resolvase RusA-like endonuclease